MVNNIPQKGDIVWFDFSPQRGHEQRGRRPAVIMTSQKYNKCGLALVCPITSKVKGYPFEVIFKTSKIEGAIMADQIKNQDWRERSVQFIDQMPQENLERAQKCIALILLN